jgi:hypothetical protein
MGWQRVPSIVFECRGMVGLLDGIEGESKFGFVILTVSSVIVPLSLLASG